MAKLINLVGEKFGRLTVTGYSHKAPNRHSYWKCSCECGSEILVGGPHLKSGMTQSCGCLHKERASAANKTHGKSRTKIHRTWKNVVQRCTNPANPSWEDYGGRGITLCDEWRDSFEAFYAHVGEPPSPKHSLDRENNGLGYQPGNMRWVLSVVQVRNRRNSVKVNYLGEMRSLMDICEQHGINYFLAYNRISRNGQDVSEAVAQLVASKEPSRKEGLEENTD